MICRILHLVGSAEPEAAAFLRIIQPLVQLLDRTRFEQHVWFLGSDGPLAGALKRDGVMTRVIPWSGIRHDPAAAWRLWNDFRRGQYSIIHQHFGGLAVQWLAHASPGARILVHLHGRESENRNVEPRPRYVFDADAVVATSQAVAQIAVGRRPRVVYPGVAIERGPKGCARGGEPRPDDLHSGVSKVMLMGTACRLAPIKGIQYLIRALALLRKDVPGAALEIAGKGAEHASLEKEAQRLGVSANVHFLGWRDDLPEVLRRWDVFVMPSLGEGFGIAALEAMAAGLPVVASEVGGLPELVQHGRTGWLVPPADAVALAERLRELFVNPEKRREMGEAGRVRAREHFSVERMVAQIAGIYEAMLGLAAR
jgi:glycosyltransferase involved in cell wall biosynthesis